MNAKNINPVFTHYGCHTQLHIKKYTDIRSSCRYKNNSGTFFICTCSQQRAKHSGRAAPVEKSLGLNLSVAMFSKWPADPWMCLQTFVTAVSLSPQSHKALSVPGWSREPRPKNRLSDKELEAAGGLRIEKRNRKIFFFPPLLSLTHSLSRSLARSCRLQARWPACLNLRNDSVADNFAIATAQRCARVLYSRLCLFDLFSGGV